MKKKHTYMGALKLGKLRVGKLSFGKLEVGSIMGKEDDEENSHSRPCEGS